jgi:hypothetical protein
MLSRSFRQLTMAEPGTGRDLHAQLIEEVLKSMTSPERELCCSVGGSRISCSMGCDYIAYQQQRTMICSKCMPFSATYW